MELRKRKNKQTVAKFSQREQEFINDVNHLILKFLREKRERQGVKLNPNRYPIHKVEISDDILELLKTKFSVGHRFRSNEPLLQHFQFKNKRFYKKNYSMYYNNEEFKVRVFNRRKLTTLDEKLAEQITYSKPLFSFKFIPRVRNDVKGPIRVNGVLTTI